MKSNIKNRRKYGVHLTSTEIFKKFILPEIENDIYKYIWVDFFCGEGNLILPILEKIPPKDRIDFFKNRIFLFDIQQKMVIKAIDNSIKYNIPKEIAEKNIICMDTLKEFPKFLTKPKYPVYHITNPPYLYIGYIVKNEKEHLKYFQNENEGYQDLYQIALINDLRNKIKKMIYIIPSNLIFGASGSNKIRDDLLPHYIINKAFIFEKKIFEFTGVNVIISFFEKKKSIKNEIINFEGIKINEGIHKRNYRLEPKNHFRASSDFDNFTIKNKSEKPLKISYYLDIKEVIENEGKNNIQVIDANDFKGNTYTKKELNVNNFLYNKIQSNVLWIRTVDTGSMQGRVGIYLIKESFNTDGILVSKVKYRTHPIQIFFKRNLSYKMQILLKDYFNLLLEYFREINDSEFLTTYKYSNSEYTRKYLGLSQVKRLIETFPISEIENDKEKLNELIKFVKNKDVDKLIFLIKNRNAKSSNQQTLF